MRFLTPEMLPHGTSIVTVAADGCTTMARARCARRLGDR
jgi:hypothetical protein